MEDFYIEDMWQDSELEIGEVKISPNSIVEISTVSHRLFKPYLIEIFPPLNLENFEWCLIYYPVQNCDYASVGEFKENFKTLVVSQRIGIRLASTHNQRITCKVSIKLKGKSVL